MGAQLNVTPSRANLNLMKCAIVVQRFVGERVIGLCVVVHARETRDERLRLYHKTAGGRGEPRQHRGGVLAVGDGCTLVRSRRVERIDCEVKSARRPSDSFDV